jgi:hypothetical protein
MWILTWYKKDQESAVYYLQNVFLKDLNKWTKREQSNVKVRIPSARNGDTNTSYTVLNTSIGKSTTEIDDPDVDEFGRRKRNPQVNVGTQVEIPLTAPTNQDTINREPTSRASSSLTNTTTVNNINAGWGYGGYSA